MFGKHKVWYVCNIPQLTQRNLGESTGINHHTPEKKTFQNNDE